MKVHQVVALAQHLSLSLGGLALVHPRDQARVKADLAQAVSQGLPDAQAHWKTTA